MQTQPSLPIDSLAVVVDPSQDNVAVAKISIPAGTQVILPEGRVIEVRGEFHPGTVLRCVQSLPGIGCASTGSPLPFRGA